MIEIKSWRDGSVLYTAKGAADVRAAVEEAARKGANLRFANLRSADLGSAEGLRPERSNSLALMPPLPPSPNHRRRDIPPTSPRTATATTCPT